MRRGKVLYEHHTDTYGSCRRRISVGHTKESSQAGKNQVAGVVSDHVALLADSDEEGSYAKKLLEDEEVSRSDENQAQKDAEL